MRIGLKQVLAKTGYRLIVTAAILGPAVPVAAQWGPPPPPPPSMIERMCADQEALFAARMAFIETKIALKVEQRTDWEAFVTAARAAEQPLRELCANPPRPPKSDDPIAVLEARDHKASMHAAIRQATQDAVARLKAKLAADQRRSLAEALLSPPGSLGPGLHTFAPPGFGPAGVRPPGFTLHGPPPLR